MNQLVETRVVEKEKRFRYRTLSVTKVHVRRIFYLLDHLRRFSKILRS